MGFYGHELGLVTAKCNDTEGYPMVTVQTVSHTISIGLARVD